MKYNNINRFNNDFGATNFNDAPIRSNICAVITTYHPDKYFPNRIYNIINQVDNIVIVDNHSNDMCLDMIMYLSNKLKLHLITNSMNFGVAKALNQGIRFASQYGYKYVLTFDQDTDVHPQLVQYLRAAYLDCTFKNNIGIIGSNYQEIITGKEFVSSIKNNDKFWLEINEVITSGSLMPIKVYEIIGPFREEFFIDLVDFEYCLRIRKMGFKILITPKIGIIQNFGDCKILNLFWIKIIVRDYAPIRNYYRSRNGLILFFEYFWKDNIWAFRRLILILLRPFSILFFENNKLLKFKYIILGIYHALFYKIKSIQFIS